MNIKKILMLQGKYVSDRSLSLHIISLDFKQKIDNKSKSV